MTSPWQHDQAKRNVSVWLGVAATVAVLSVIVLTHRSFGGYTRKFVFMPLLTKLDKFACLLRRCDLAEHALREVAVDTLGNALIFVPLGVVLTLALRKSTHPILLAMLLGAGLSITYEVIQVWLPGRVVAIDDVLLNTAGTGLGAWLSLLAGRLCRQGK